MIIVYDVLNSSIIHSAKFAAIYVIDEGQRGARMQAKLESSARRVGVVAVHRFAGK